MMGSAEHRRADTELAQELIALRERLDALRRVDATEDELDRVGVELHELLARIQQRSARADA
jgi:hypothetical protein